MPTKKQTIYPRTQEDAILDARDQLNAAEAGAKEAGIDLGWTVVHAATDQVEDIASLPKAAEAPLHTQYTRDEGTIEAEDVSAGQGDAAWENFANPKQ
jgi:hypothetical protein